MLFRSMRGVEVKAGEVAIGSDQVLVHVQHACGACAAAAAATCSAQRAGAQRQAGADRDLLDRSGACCAPAQQFAAAQIGADRCRQLAQ